MAVAAAFSGVTRTTFSPYSQNHSPNTQPILHCSKSLLITIPHTKLNVSRGEDELGEFDEGSMYSNDFIDEDKESDDTESSIDLLFRFFQSMFKKVSKRVRKASRSVLPSVIPPQLVTFGVNGVLLLASLSILKAFLEVACTIGGTVFVVILLLRVIWAAISYFQSNQDDFNRSGPSYSRTQLRKGVLFTILPNQVQGNGEIDLL